MLPIERAIKRLEKSKKYKSKNIDYDIEYLAILRRRLDFLYLAADKTLLTEPSDFIRAVGFSQDEKRDMMKEYHTVKFLCECLEKKIWRSNQKNNEVENV